MGNVSSRIAEHPRTLGGFISVNALNLKILDTVTIFWTTPYWTLLFVVYDIVWLFRVVVLKVQTIVLLTATFGYVMTRNGVHTGFLLSVCRHWLMAPNSSSDSTTGHTLPRATSHRWAGFSDVYKYGMDITFTHVHVQINNIWKCSLLQSAHTRKAHLVPLSWDRKSCSWMGQLVHIANFSIWSFHCIRLDVTMYECRWNGSIIPVLVTTVIKLKGQVVITLQ